MSVMLNRANFLGEDEQPGCDALGPFDFVSMTYNSVVRVGPDHDGDRQIAHFKDGLWRFDDGTEWTDITVTAAES